MPRRRGVRLSSAVALLAALAVAGAQLSAGMAVAEPPSSADKIATLINQIADTNQNMANLDGDVAVKREAVNRALVDLQNARESERLAAVAVRGAQESLKLATGAIALAEKDFDGFIRSLYTQGNSQDSMGSYLSGEPGAVLDRASVIDQLSKDQQATITRLQQARNEEANRASTTQATQQQAAFATATAETRQADAQTAIAEATAAVKAEQSRRAMLEKDRAAAQEELNKLRGQPAPAPPTEGGGQVPILPEQQAAIEQQAHQDALRAAGDAAGKLALNTAQQTLAAIVGSLTAPHTDIDGATPPPTTTPTDPNAPLDPTLPADPDEPFDPTLPTEPTTPAPGTVDPGLSGSAAVEVVVNRALSQLGVTYSWGGGDANGPTLGIRDGGVADSYGDYNKVGFDCSGLMIYAFAGIGVSLPHYTGYQYTSGPQVPLSQMQRGDMIFYGPNASEHVALYLGDNTMVEAPQSGDVVKISPLRTSGAMPYVVRLT
ncbi:NlpC/P60 family protein [Williamsia sp. 1135]|uniref:NlpC/P60 family protein n=1 Tax=Williamsia sp. 1135 TaxID=1889262 RepID=UPI0019801860|nr:NlpC/P60 family protein [Williamsia sp. 1135]